MSDERRAEVKKKDNRVVLTIRVPEDLKWDLEKLAVENRAKSLNDYITSLFADVVEQEKVA